MRPANRFTADLLLGGVRLQRLVCELHEVPNNDEELWTGRFQIPRSQLELFEVDRPYLMELDDGRQGRVIVHTVQPMNDDVANEDSALQVELGFRPAEHGNA